MSLDVSKTQNPQTSDDYFESDEGEGDEEEEEVKESFCERIFCCFSSKKKVKRKPTTKYSHRMKLATLNNLSGGGKR